MKSVSLYASACAVEGLQRPRALWLKPQSGFTARHLIAVAVSKTRLDHPHERWAVLRQLRPRMSSPFRVKQGKE
jgi:hypothetical protein